MSKLFPTLVIAVLMTVCVNDSAFARTALEVEFGQVCEPDPFSPTKIDKFISSGRYEKALSLIEKEKGVLSDSHLFAQALCASCLTGDYKKAEEYCNKWLEANKKPSTDPTTELDKSFIQLFLKTCHSKETGNKQGSGNYIDNMLTMFRRVPVYELDDNSKGQNPLISKAKELENLGQFKQAAESYRKALLSKNEDYLTLASLALCELTDAISNPKATERAAQFKDVHNDFKKSLAINRKDWRVVNDYAAAVYLQNPRDAIPLIEETLKISGLPPFQHTALSTALREAKREPTQKF